MENKLLTVVIPAYNSSSYLGKCLESLLVEDVMNDVESSSSMMGLLMKL